ncbi:hypothetical protein NA57DRAFT_52743 [Rhizodiscina lignyota]|uniref:Uncharacterized protein n=1 Tax=Rhizodiscina lignyota TaxID=1504668 RepID=A0A9P4IRK6_9PEZI|nr:hypothetical protein NA57DRAFT_52743 [Rhizodiscina lignyota]
MLSLKFFVVALTLFLSVFVEGYGYGGPNCSTCQPVTVTSPILFCPAEKCTGPIAQCILLKSTIVPSATCSYSTVTVPGTCPGCQHGCRTETRTISTTGCVPPSPTTPCFVATTTLDEILHCPFIPAPTTSCPSPCSVTRTVTRPTPNVYCPDTYTVTITPTCPTDGCSALCPTVTTTVTQLGQS